VMVGSCAAFCVVAKQNEWCIPPVECLGRRGQVFHYRNERAELVKVRFEHQDGGYVNATVEVPPGKADSVRGVACHASVIILLDAADKEISRLNGGICRDVTWTIPASGPPVLTDGVPPGS
jgi:hypothetical protein